MDRTRPVSPRPQTRLPSSDASPADYAKALGRTGDDCLLATKVMIPLDGPVREGVGLLGSPSFEIPRSVHGDSRFDHLKTGDEFRRRLAAKNKYNLATVGLFLLVRWIHVLIVTLLALAAVDVNGTVGTFAVSGFLILTVLFGTTYLVLVERAVASFRALRPKFC